MVGLGVDIGGSSVKAARVDLQSGRRLSERLSVPTPPGGEPGEVAAAVAGLCGQLSGREAGGREAGGSEGGSGPLGVAFPGVVVGGRTLTAANVGRAWLGLDAAALAEARFGAARGHWGTALVLTFGTGIGSGLLRGGCLVPNTELGHLRLERGQEAEAWAAARVKTAQGLSWPQWAARANRVIAELEALLWPDLLVIGGGLSGDSARWLPLLQSRAPLRPAAPGGARRRSARTRGLWGRRCGARRNPEDGTVHSV